MKLEVAIDGRAAKLEVDAGKFRYQREDGEAMERDTRLRRSRRVRFRC